MASAHFERYGIYRADLNPTRGSESNKIRPVVIVSLDALNAMVETVVVCLLTSQLHPRWRTRVQIRCQGKKAEIAVDQIRTISKRGSGQQWISSRLRTRVNFGVSSLKWTDKAEEAAPRMIELRRYFFSGRAITLCGFSSRS
jgi:mRNA interferase MazF